MFNVKYVVTDSKIDDYFEINMANGITNDILLICKSSIYVRTDYLSLKKYPTNTVFFFPKGTAYYYTPCRGEQYRDCYIQFTCDDPFYVRHMISDTHPFGLRDPDRIYNLIEMIAFENILNGPNRGEILDNLMKTLFIKLSESTTVSDNTPYYNELLKIRYNIFKHPEIKWTLNMIAGLLHMSTAYAHSLYKNAFKTTFMQDVIESRIQCSKHALAYSEHTISEIAVISGYNSAAHFCRQFRKYTGISPSQYRKSKNMIS